MKYARLVSRRENRSKWQLEDTKTGGILVPNPEGGLSCGFLLRCQQFLDEREYEFFRNTQFLLDYPSRIDGWKKVDIKEGHERIESLYYLHVETLDCFEMTRQEYAEGVVFFVGLNDEMGPPFYDEGNARNELLHRIRHRRLRDLLKSTK